MKVMGEKLKKDLTDRERDILLKVTDIYIKTGEPVGSRTVQKVYNMDISPATIRNVMADLEDKGFLYQPHTSAGRVPTDKGLKVYINHLFLALGEEDSTLVNQLTEFVTHLGLTRPEEILVKVLDFLQSHTGYLGFGVNFVETLNVKEVTLIKVGRDRVLMVIKFYPEYIVHKIMELEVPDSELPRLSKELTRRLKGKALADVKKELVNEINAVREEFSALSFRLNTQILSAVNSLTQLKFQGTPNIVNIVSDDIERLKEVLRLLEEKNLLLEILSKFLERNRETDVILGSETNIEPFEPFGIVISKFHVGFKNSGVVGILGPRRMDYSQIIPIVENVAKALSHLMGRDEK